ncbi:acetolactate synthase-1/2/3 large subunit [Actinomycetospora succinea]|uniref:Acetolactate synthase-1/2/3 large subunit n=1 Tax=Actinomycetospora succinea TaxID=663603 RepID=A0A4R6UND1_9PSEU|nr:acetolactate synthase large subunit [Actinomycetospora succinea]TDQ46983.1 acetolactate synthase-1/2/3 large subunit [Actinomycetospora succinea]
MRGAEALVGSLVGAGVDVCFMNPGTSEMHFVQALDDVPEMRGVLTLFEGVATGAADAHARITGRPAAVLLHLGPGLGNGLANLHNARRAGTPLVCVVGAHATDHVRHDAPLESDITALARTVSGWVHTCGDVRDVADDAVRAVAAAAERGGRVATLVLPADVSWSEGGAPAPALPAAAPFPPAPSRVAIAAAAVRSGGAVILLGGPALTERAMDAAGRVAAATGARLLVETFPRCWDTGAGRPRADKLAYFAEQALEQLDGASSLVLAGARSPVSFFGYPGIPGDLVPDGATVVGLADAATDAEAALEALAVEVAPDAAAEPAPRDAPEPAPGPLDVRSLCAAVAATLPEDAIVIDESLTAAAVLAPALQTAAPHTQLALTGGAIGQGPPAAVGAAVAAPDRSVVAVQADGSALYTLQALWTQAREQLDVTTVLINNAAYAILRVELARTGVGEAAHSGRAGRMLTLTDPTPDFVSLATGYGVPARRVETTEDLLDALRWAHDEPGPHLIEAIVPAVG